MSAPPFGRTVPGNRWDLLDGQWPATPPRVSVVVAHYEQPAELERTLAALRAQTHPADRLEVLVVDDGSARAPVVPDGVRLLRQEDRGFRAGAVRNLGAAHARGDVLVFLDADTTPEPDAIRALTRLPALAPEAVTVGRRRHAELAGATGPIAALGPPRELPEPAWLARGYAVSRDLLDADERSYRFLISAVMACTRWFFGEVGPFDESLSGYGGEDWEWAHRAWQAGAILAHVPGAVAWHDGADWAGRERDPAAARAGKNREAAQLAARVPLPGSGPRALRGPVADHVVRLPAGGSAAAVLVCVDAFLLALPQATILVPAEHHAALATDARVQPAPATEQVARALPASATGQLPRARLVLDVERHVRPDAEALRAAVARVTAEQLGSLTLTGERGEPLVRVWSRRAAARTARWRDAELFAEVREHAPWVVCIDAQPDLEGYFGGWA